MTLVYNGWMPGEEHHYKNKYEELQADYADLKEQYAHQQLIIQAYQSQWNNRHPLPHMLFGFEWPYPSLREGEGTL